MRRFGGPPLRRNKAETRRARSRIRPRAVPPAAGASGSRGPQRRLYLPSPLLHQGSNEIIVLELDRSGGVGPLSVRSEPDLGPVAAPSTPWSFVPADVD